MIKYLNKMSTLYDMTLNNNLNKLILLFFTAFMFIPKGYSQINADPGIAILMGSPSVSQGSTEILMASVGNYGNETIVENSLRVTISVGANSEIIGIATGSDTRWNQLSLTIGSANTIVLTNSGGGFDSFNVGDILLTVRGNVMSDPDVVLGNIVYIAAQNPAICPSCAFPPLNASQGNISNSNDNATTSLAVTGLVTMACSIVQDKLAATYNTKDGVATVNPIGGSGSYTYIWDNGETTQTATTLTYGLHNVTVTDSNGSASICEIDIAKELYCYTKVRENVCVFEGSDGVAKVNGHGGYSPYTYEWEDGSTEQINRRLTVGLHYVTVTDAKGATSECSVEITCLGSACNPPVLTTMACNIVQDKLAATYNTKDGVATVNPIGGSGSYIYLWDNGETTQTATTLTYGSHTVTVTDSNGSPSTCEIDIAKELYCYTQVLENVSKFRGSNGVAKVYGHGGYSPYTYEWDDGSTEQINRRLTAGRHSVTVTDSKGATSQCSVEITCITNNAKIKSNEKFKVTLAQNPSADTFKLLVESRSRENLCIRIMDPYGKMINESILPYKDIINLRNELSSSLYFIEVRQGEERVILKALRL